MITHDVFGAVDGGILVGTLVAGAKCLAALFLLALVTVALHVVGVLDRSVTVGAFDGVAALAFIWCVRTSENKLKTC